jgi:hypothetical protein
MWRDISRFYTPPDTFFPLRTRNGPCSSPIIIGRFLSRTVTVTSPPLWLALVQTFFPRCLYVRSRFPVHRFPPDTVSKSEVFSFFPPVCLPCVRVGLSLPVSSTLVSPIYGSLAYPISALSIIVHPEFSAAHFPQSTQESWASRTHVEPRSPGYPGLDQNLLGFVLCQPRVSAYRTSYRYPVSPKDSLAHSRTGAKTVWVSP